MRTIGVFGLMIFAAGVFCESAGIAESLESSTEANNFESTTEEIDEKITTENNKITETTVDSLAGFSTPPITENDLLQIITEASLSETSTIITETTQLTRNEEETDLQILRESTEENITSSTIESTDLPTTETTTPSQSTSGEVSTTSKIDLTSLTDASDESTEVTDTSGLTETTSSEQPTTRQPDVTAATDSSSGTSKDKEGKEQSSTIESSTESITVSSIPSIVTEDSPATTTISMEESVEDTQQTTASSFVCECQTVPGSSTSGCSSSTTSKTDENTVTTTQDPLVTDTPESSTDSSASSSVSSDASVSSEETTTSPTEETSSGSDTISSEFTTMFPASNETESTTGDEETNSSDPEDSSSSLGTSESTDQLPPSSSTLSPVTNSTDVSETTTGKSENYTGRFDYLVRDETTGIYCTLSKMNISIRVLHKRSDGMYILKKLWVPRTANVQGTCGQENSTMTLSWAEPETEETIRDTGRTHNITFFLVNDGSTFYVNSITVDVYIDWIEFNNQSGKLSASENVRLFEASLENGIHRCESKTVQWVEDIALAINDVSLIAFNHENDLSSRSEESCLAPRKQTSGNGWLIFGGIVVVVIVIGIVVFAIRRSRRRTRRFVLP